MRPEVWRPPVEPSPAERAVIKAVRRAKLFVFLREHRHELFDEQFQAELAGAYVDSAKGQPPVPPARLALATALPSGCPGVPIAALEDGSLWPTVLQRNTTFGEGDRLQPPRMRRPLLPRGLTTARRRWLG